DTSGSMAARRRLDAVTGSCVALLRDAYVRRDLVSVVEAHGSSASVAVPPTRSIDVAVGRLAGIETGGRTPLAEGLSEVVSLLERRRVVEPDRGPCWSCSRMVAPRPAPVRWTGPSPRPGSSADENWPRR